MDICRKLNKYGRVAGLGGVSDDFVQRTHWRAEQTVMKTRWLIPCSLLLASCASFSGDDTNGIDDDVDAASSAAEGDAATDASSSVVTPPDGMVESDAAAVEDAGMVEDAGTVDAAPPPIDELTETYGIFVSLAGSLDGDGTREAPLSTIGAGIAKAKQDGKRVYVCKGTYKEAVELKSKVSVFGGYSCTTKWERKEGEYSRVESPTSPAVWAKDITDLTTFSGFDVVSPDGSSANVSSIGLIAENAGKLVIAAAKITAGQGVAGASGVEPVGPTLGAGINGNPGRARRVAKPGDPVVYPNRNGGATAGGSICGAPSGGQGGHGAYGACACKSGVCSVTIPLVCYIAENLKDATCDSQAPGAGAGAAGAVGLDGVSAVNVGYLSSAGYQPADGTAGTSGEHGAGGRGGLSEPVNSSSCLPDAKVSFASGAGGGAGGCRGIAGTPGKGGGASIAALVWSSPGLVFDDTALLGGKGGAGGKGTLGAVPTAGGKAGTTASGAGDALNGGDGGRPGVSGSGAGGPSFGVAVHGSAPKLVNGSVAKAGAGGAGVGVDSKTALGVTWKLPASTAGLSKDLYEF